MLGIRDYKGIKLLYFYYWHDYYYNEYLPSMVDGTLRRKERREEDFSSPWTPDWSALTASHFIVFYQDKTRMKRTY